MHRIVRTCSVSCLFWLCSAILSFAQVATNSIDAQEPASKDSAQALDTNHRKHYNNDRIRFGVDVGFLASSVPANGVSDVPNCCSDFSTGSGIGYGASFAFTNSIHGKLGYYVRAAAGLARSVSSENRTIGLTNLNGIATKVDVQYELDLSMMWMSVGAGLEYWLFENLAAGGDFFVAHQLSNRHSQSENLLTPNTKFSDGTRVRNIFNDRALSGKLFTGFNVNVRYSCALAKKLRLEPTLGIQQTISSPSELLQHWTWFSIRGGLTVLFEL